MWSRPSRRSVVAAAALGTVALLATSACSLSNTDDGNAAHVVVGYQSKTLNTVTAGTLLRADGDFEKQLKELSKTTGKKYVVDWQDYDTGAPITTGMIAGKIDIGSMGDYPLLINGSRATANPATTTEMLSVTGSSATGALNGVVVAPGSTATSLADLRGKAVSASVGSAGHGTLVRALGRLGIDPTSGVSVRNQQPQIGASALESGRVDALSQFAAWPGLLVFQNKAKLLYDGGQLGVPTLHGVVARKQFIDQNADIVTAFLRAQLDTAAALAADPLRAAQTVADATKLPAEVVYLYNGPGGADLNPAVKQSLVDALRGDQPYLKSIGSFPHELDLGTFINTGPLAKAFAAAGRDYNQALTTTEIPALTGHDPVCNKPIPATGGAELWISGANTTQPAADPTCLLRAIKKAQSDHHTIRVAYVFDHETGTRWFADKAVWLRDGTEYIPFTTADGANRYAAQHPGAAQVTYDRAVAEVV